MRNHILANFLIVALAGAASAQTGSYTYLNQLKPYTNPKTTMLKALGVPKIGTTFKVQVPLSWRQRNGVGENVVLASGVKNPFLAIPVFRGYVFTSAEVITPTPMSSLGIPGTTTMQFAIPLSSQLVGLKVFQQVLAVSTKGPFVARLSRGGVGVVGK